MRRDRFIAVGMALLAAVCAASPARAEPGTLIVVGGGLQPDNAEIFSAFLEARPSSTPGIAIIAAASGEPRQSADAFRDALVHHGANGEDIVLIELAVVDDPSTPDVDEAQWAGNADAPREIARIRQAGAIWFSGGDQSRLTRTLIASDGEDTAMLAAIRQRLREGAAIGGTSAGAAIMSDPMITQGDSMAALLPGTPGEAVDFGRGLGFVEGLVVDQHFGQRARLGRLAAVLLDPSQPHRVGVGVDEDTALILRSGGTTARIAGSGYVTWIDAREALREEAERFGASNLALAIAASGDTIDLATGALTPAPFRNATIGNEYYDTPSVAGGGMAMGDTSLSAVLGEALLDNAAARTVERQSFSGRYGVTYRFSQTDGSRGWWGRGPDGAARYAVSDVRFDIEPLDIIMRKAEP